MSVLIYPVLTYCSSIFGRVFGSRVASRLPLLLLLLCYLSEYGPIIGSHDSYLLPDFSGFKSLGIVVLSHNLSLLD